MLNSFTEAILSSSDYSTNVRTCIDYIRNDLETYLGPIIEMLESDPDSCQKEAEELRALFADNEFARAIMDAIWPHGTASCGGESAIARELRAKLAPIAERLSEQNLSSIKIPVIALLKQLYEAEQPGELATAEGLFANIVVDPCHCDTRHPWKTEVRRGVA